MSFNTFGHLFRVTTFGESHGPAIGCVVDGCPPGIPLTEADIQPYLDKRRPGQSRFTTQRAEPDQVRILSGVFQDDRMGAQVTTGTPIGLLIDNVDQARARFARIPTAIDSPLDTLAAHAPIIDEHLSTAGGRAQTVLMLESVLAAARGADEVAAEHRCMWRESIAHVERLLREEREKPKDPSGKGRDDA